MTTVRAIVILNKKGTSIQKKRSAFSLPPMTYTLAKIKVPFVPPKPNEFFIA